MTCDILLTRDDQQVIAARIELMNGRVTARPTEYGSVQLVRNILSNSNFAGSGDRVRLKDDPKGWFMALPFTYNGSHVRARING